MNKKDNRIISAIADKMNINDKMLTESLYGFRVSQGKKAIDYFINHIESEYIDWDWDNKKFQQGLELVYTRNGLEKPTTPEQLALELSHSDQQNELKKKLMGLLGVESEEERPEGETDEGPGGVVKGFVRGKSYTVEYENFQGKILTFNNITFIGQQGPHLMFSTPKEKPGKRNLIDMKVKFYQDRYNKKQSSQTNERLAKWRSLKQAMAHHVFGYETVTLKEDNISRVF